MKFVFLATEKKKPSEKEKEKKKKREKKHPSFDIKESILFFEKITSIKSPFPSSSFVHLYLTTHAHRHTNNNK